MFVEQTLQLRQPISYASLFLLLRLIIAAGFSGYAMKYILFALGSWALLNLLYVFIVIPPRKGRHLPASLARPLAGIKKFVQRGRQPPS